MTKTTGGSKFLRGGLYSIILLILLFLSALIFISCSSSGDDSSPAPVLINPVNLGDDSSPAPVSENTSNPSDKNQVFNLSESEKSTIAGLSSASLTDSISSLQQISSILSSHSAEKGVSEQLSIIQKVQGSLNNSGLERSIGAAISETPAKIEKADYQSFITTKKEGDAENYSSWFDYSNEYDLALQEIEKYNSYYEGEYTTLFTAYEAASKSYSEKLSALSNPGYDDVEEFAKAVVADFKDNYLFDNKNLNYDENQISSLVQTAVDELATIKSSLGTAFTAYETAQKAYSEGYFEDSGVYVESAVYKLTNLKNNADFRVSEAVKKSENLQSNSNPSETEQENFDDGKYFTVTFNFNYDSNIHIEKVESGKTVAEPIVSYRDGYESELGWYEYTFLGWYLESDFETKFDFRSLITEDIVLYAKWDTCFYEKNFLGGIVSINENRSDILVEKTESDGLVSFFVSEEYDSYLWYIDSELIHSGDNVYSIDLKSLLDGIHELFIVAKKDNYAYSYRTSLIVK
jgi:uncharacterized repeat protein (TIGR02543 family)